MLVASNRGPVAFAAGDDGELVLRRGAGGLVSGLSQAAADAPAEALPMVWVCAALGDADRRAVRATPGGRLDLAGHDTGGTAVRMLDVEPTVFDRAYNAIANRTLWFIQHLLYAPATQPVFGPVFRRDWAAYEAYNDMFAEALAHEAAPGAAVLVQDYHLTLVPGRLRELRPDLRIAHFSHTPWAPPEYFRLLPDDIGEQILRGMLGADRLGFLTDAWADAFEDCVRALPGVRVEPRELLVAPPPGGWPSGDPQAPRTVRIGVHPLGVDADELRARAGAPDVAARAAELRRATAGCRLIVRVDRTELSKNIVRGLAAYRELLRSRPQWRGKVTHLVCAYPSRHDLPEYREYTAAVLRLAAEIEDEFATEGWRPLRLELTDDYPRSIAALALAEVLVVNPIRDGMNLVAKEGPVLSHDGAALVLSREAGACAEMGSAALVINPFDIEATAAALHTALTMPPADRRRRADELAAVAGLLPPRIWFTDQLAALTADS
ncbi:Alpha,alpha-trehalose-phosphate synthase [Frankia canadensis]|uniref:Alpha,alpha-trehalose-phosphate synthase n=1 Tax=Frankia canadensis TaxID=1836972 RepID=A0A2I2KV76_9ACTN|nr:trehalose-6-phosphate synthase [Frankia canadensis]SNQ49561.1 Alpha,alpha-trehalose-phosphate synthase [Frankia canadensis]SOU56851.1 Alpha,alpha-trehalose-phosphate synthase [Frankia canadensis]